MGKLKAFLFDAKEVMENNIHLLNGWPDQLVSRYSKVIAEKGNNAPPIPFVNQSNQQSLQGLASIIGPDRFATELIDAWATGCVKQEIVDRARALIRNARVKNYTKALNLVEQSIVNPNDVDFEFGDGMLDVKKFKKLQKDQAVEAEKLFTPSPHKALRRLKPSFLEQSMKRFPALQARAQRLAQAKMTTMRRLMPQMAAKATFEESILSSPSFFVSQFLSENPKGYEEVHKALNAMVYEAAKQSAAFADTVEALEALRSEQKRVQALAKQSATSSEDRDATFVFDGKTRSMSETRYSKSEYEAFTRFVGSDEFQRQHQSYQAKFAVEKQKVTDELKAEHGKINVWDDVEVLAAQRLMDRGIEPPEDPRKIFAYLPQSIQEMPEQAGDGFASSEKVVAALQWLTQNSLTALSFSGGKDSTAVAALLFEALKRNKAQGIQSKPVYVLNSHTGVENPEVVKNMNRDLDAFRKWSAAHDLDVNCIQVTPSLNDVMQVSVIGGRTLFNYPNKGGQCSSDWKVKPMSALREQIRKAHPEEPIVSLTGMRFDESIMRRTAMKKRNDSSLAISVNKDNHLMFAPIAHWTQKMVFELIYDLSYESGLAMKNGLGLKGMPYPTDLTDTIRIYEDAAGACPMTSDTVAKSNSGGCGAGARHGCWSCVKVGKDKSAENMLAKPEYEYMRALTRYRDWVAASQYDMSTRTWVGRTIHPDGTVSFKYDVYTSEFLEDNLKYLLSIQADAESRGNPNKLEVITMEQLLAIEYKWSQMGRNTPWRTLELWSEIFEKGARYEPPIVDASRFSAPPSHIEARLKIGTPFKDFDPDTFERLDEQGRPLPYQGLSSMELDLYSPEDSDLTHTEHFHELNGSTVKLLGDIERAQSFAINSESLSYFLQFEMDSKIKETEERRARGDFDSNRVYAGSSAAWMLQYGLVQANNVTEAHRLITRSQLFESVGLAGKFDHNACVDRLIDQNGRPLTAQEKSDYRVEKYISEEKGSFKGISIVHTDLRSIDDSEQDKPSFQMPLI